MVRRRPLGAAAGCLLILAACSEAPAPPRDPALRVEAVVAATVNGTPIYLTDVELEAAAQGLIAPGEPFAKGHPDYQPVLDQLIDQRLMAQEAEARDLDDNPPARRRLQAARERVLGNILVEDLVASEVTEESIRSMYEEQVALQQVDDEVAIRHIVTETREAADTARARILDGEDFTTVAFEMSVDTETRVEGGALGFVAPNRLGEPFASAIANTRTGDLSEPFESDEGWHILRVDERRTPPPKTLEEMRPEIVTFLTYRQISRILKDLRAEATIEQGAGVPHVDDLPEGAGPDRVVAPDAANRREPAVDQDDTL